MMRDIVTPEHGQQLADLETGEGPLRRVNYVAGCRDGGMALKTTVDGFDLAVVRKAIRTRLGSRTVARVEEP